MENYKKIVEDIKHIKDNGYTKVDYNSRLNYIGIDHYNEDGELIASYFIDDNETMDILQHDYKNSSLNDVLFFEDYVLYVSQDW